MNSRWRSAFELAVDVLVRPRRHRFIPSVHSSRICGNIFRHVTQSWCQSRPPGVDPVRDALLPSTLRHRPRLADVLGPALARGEQDEARAQHVEVPAGERRHEVERRGDPEVVGELVGRVEEPAQVVGARSSRAPGRTRRGTGTPSATAWNAPIDAPGRPDLDVGRLAVGADRRARPRGGRTGGTGSAATSGGAREPSRASSALPATLSHE